MNFSPLKKLIAKVPTFTSSSTGEASSAQERDGANREMKEGTYGVSTDNPAQEGDGASLVNRDNDKKEKQWSFDKILYYALIFFAPLFFLPLTLSPVGVNKQMFVGIVVLSLFVYVLAQFLTKGKIEFPRTLALYAAAGLFLAVLVSAIFSQARIVSFLGNSPDSLFWIAMYVLSFVLGLVILRDKKAITMSAISYILSMGVLVIFSFLQFSGIKIFPFDFAQTANFNTIGSTFAVGFVIAAAFVALLSFLTVTRVKDKKWKAGFWVLLGVMGLFILQLNLWNIWLALALTFVVVSVIVGYVSMGNKKEFNLKPLLIPFLVIIIALLGVFIQFVIPTFISVPAELGATPSATLNIAKDSLSGVHALYGTGPGTFPYNYSRFRSADINLSQFWGTQFSQGYSAFLTYISTWGVLGTLAMLFVLVAFYKTLLSGLMRGARENSGNALYGIALGAFGASIFFGISTFMYRGNVVMYLLLFIAVAIGMAALHNMKALKSWRFSLLNLPTVMLASSLVVILIVSSVLGTLYFLSKDYLAQVYAAQGVIEFRNNGDIDSALVKLDQALKANPNNDEILRVSSQALMVKAIEIANDTKLSQEERNNLFTNTFQRAIQISQFATEANPSSVQNWLQSARVYEQVVGIAPGADALAISAYQQARELDPFNPSLPLAQARVYVIFADVLQNAIEGAPAIQQQELIGLRIEKLNNAVDKLNESVELKNNYATARFLLATTYRRLGNLDAAVEQTQEIARISPNDANVAFQLGLFYYESERFENAAASLGRAISLADGSFGNARYYLGLAYVALENRAAAVGQFERLVIDNPDNALANSVLENLKAGRDPLFGLEAPSTTAPLPDTGGAQTPVLQ